MPTCLRGSEKEGVVWVMEGEPAVSGCVEQQPAQPGKSDDDDDN